MNPDLADLHPVSGRIFQINASNGGVPKLALPVAEIGFLGLAGDRQNNQELHGGVDRAVTLYSLEHILALQGEGHYIYPGAVGENLTIAGLEWELLAPDSRLRLGEAVLLQVTRYTSPCSTIADVFINHDYSRISQKRNPGWSRLSARVLQPGSVRVGAPVWIE